MSIMHFQSVVCAIGRVFLNIGTLSASGNPVASLNLSVNTDGTLTSTGSGTVEGWQEGQASANYECRLTLNSGSSPGGLALNTWYACTADRAWLWSTGSPTYNSNCTLEIRGASNQVVVATETFAVSLVGGP